jgi:hypothetical protein
MVQKWIARISGFGGWFLPLVASTSSDFSCGSFSAWRRYPCARKSVAIYRPPWENVCVQHGPG